MKKYIRICVCCGNTYETDFKESHTCKWCLYRMKYDISIYAKYISRPKETPWGSTQHIMQAKTMSEWIEEIKNKPPILKEEERAFIDAHKKFLADVRGCRYYLRRLIQEELKK